MNIPSMGGTGLGPWLQKWALDADVVVELGTWLGAATAQLASTCQGVIHTYDIFEIRGNEVEKAAKYEMAVTVGQDSLKLVQKLLADYTNIIYHKGKISSQPWDGTPIDLYVDDACKYEPEFLDALRRFSPSWIPGKTVCVFMDYWWYLSRTRDKRAKFQKNFLSSQRGCFEHIMSDKHLGCAAFKYLGGLCV